MLAQPLPQFRQGAHGLENQGNLLLQNPRGSLQNLGNSLAPHPGDDDDVYLTGTDTRQAVAQPERHLIPAAILPGRLTGTVQRTLPQVGGDSPGDLALQQQAGGQIGVVGAHIGQPRPLGHQISRQPQPGREFDMLFHKSSPPAF